MVDGKDNKEKRASPLFNPELIIQVLIPVLFAVGSGFIMHDRALSELRSATESNTEQLKTSGNFSVELQILKERVAHLDLTSQEAQHTENDMKSLTRLIDRQSVLNDEQIKEFQIRLREIERKIDKLEK